MSRFTRTNQHRRLMVMRSDNYQCVYCGTSENLTLDHLVPKDKGGSNKKRNLRTACLNCNMRKGSRTPFEAGMLLKYGRYAIGQHNSYDQWITSPLPPTRERWKHVIEQDFCFWDNSTIGRVATLRWIEGLAKWCVRFVGENNSIYFTLIWDADEYLREKGFKCAKRYYEGWLYHQRRNI